MFRFIAPDVVVLLNVRCMDALAFLVFLFLICLSYVLGRVFASMAEERLIVIEASEISLFKVMGWFRAPTKFPLELLFVIFVRLCVA